ncbi:hypothetical protein OROGR_018537 [Orobanche gracilis]
MALFRAVTWFLAIAFLFHSRVLPVSARKTYIVHMDHDRMPALYATHNEWYSDHLQTFTSADHVSLLYTYDVVYNGFAAALTAEEAEFLSRSNAVLGMYEDTVYTLHTTRTPEFLGLETEHGPWAGHSPQGLNKASGDVIIGVLDTGVWPESKSYRDDNMSNVPARWLGRCEAAPDFNPKIHCNKKLIGARSFNEGYKIATGDKESRSPRDTDGHGTHTSSTVAGSVVNNANVFGYATGHARGMTLTARLATYKVCWPMGCYGSDILAAMERAILDGVDILSLSLGSGSGPYFHDTVAIGAFAATEKGILVSCSAGNNGPSKGTLANVAPWILTVGAGTIDRDFPAFATLGHGKTKKVFQGVSLYSGKGMGKKPVALVYNTGRNDSSRMCLAGSLGPTEVGDKVVFCDRGISPRAEKGLVVMKAGGVGMILANTAENGEEMVSDSHLLPAVLVGKNIGDQIRKYVMTEKKPKAVLSFGGTALNVKPAPMVAAFSSRGPNTVTPEILKPDVIGPGVNILAAWPNTVGPTGLDNDTRRTEFNIISGTSMSCPHISGLAALVKAAHPDWSPSAIKSALMTTACTLDNTNSSLRDTVDGSLSTPLAHGSGHVNPRLSLSPGLVYDADSKDYIRFLCSLDYNTVQLSQIVKRNVTCDKKFRNPGQLNYPSFSVLFMGESRRVARYTRKLTNVGAPGSAYEVSVEAPKNVGVIVKPKKLVFEKVGARRQYTVTFVSKRGAGRNTARDAHGSIVWKNKLHQVRSPVSFSWQQ